MKLSASVAALVATSACLGAPIGSADSAGKAQIGSFGLDLASGDSRIRPGDDFFEHASGHWSASFQIPADRASYGAFQALSELTEQRVRKIIDAARAANPAPHSPERKIGDLYAAFMDESLIEAKGLQSAQPDLRRIAAATSRADIARLIALAQFRSFFALTVRPDLLNPDRYSLRIGQSGLGLPNRDYYLKDDAELKKVRSKYRDFLQQMLELAGIRDASEQASEVLVFESKLARAHWSVEQQRDIEANYNPCSKQQLLSYAPGFAWQAYLDAAQIGARRDFILKESSAIKATARLVGDTPVATLQSYLIVHYLSEHADYLPQRFGSANFAFYGTVLNGQPTQRARWKRAVEAVDQALGDEIGRRYVAQYFPPQSKLMMAELVENVRAALKERIDQLSWMTPATKRRAQEKLASIVSKVGYPERWTDYSALDIRRDDPIGNAHRAAQWEWRRNIARLDLPVDREEWGMPPQTVNAFYNALNNEIVFPAAFLQPPFFDPNAESAVNYGAIGAVIGHEIGHGFDDQGRQFGPNGNLTDWWTPEDDAAFKARAAQLIEQYSAFEALPGLHVNGALTIGENIGDLGGLNMAYHAYQRALQGREAPVVGGLTGDQRFFLSYAQIWRAKYRDGALRRYVLNDTHSPERFRVNGPLRNIDAWYAAFDVKPGDQLYLSPARRVEIW